MVFEVKNTTRYGRLMQFQVKLRKAVEITYLKASKETSKELRNIFTNFLS